MSLGLYLHFPFCTNKCAYCDFYKEVHRSDLETRYFESLKLETRLAFDRLTFNQPEIDTIYIGGGTPSLANLEQLSGWLDLLKNLARIAPECEFTLECNPESATREKLKSLKDIGVTRPVIGVQSFDPKLLKRLDRKHEVAQSHEAIYLASALGFKTFGVDIIFGLPGQTGKLLSADLDTVVDLDPPHVSFYQLTVESGTPLARKVDAGKVKLPDNDLMLGMYSGGVEKFEEAGLHRYEVSSFARADHECRHNLKYWTGGEYLGLGPGAHSFIEGRRFAVVDDLVEYTRVLNDNVWPVVEDKSGESERMAETIMLGLRMTEGVSYERFAARFGVPVTDCVDSKSIDLFKQSGHLEDLNDRLRLTSDGMLVADEVIRRLLK